LTLLTERLLFSYFPVLTNWVRAPWFLNGRAACRSLSSRWLCRRRC